MGVKVNITSAVNDYLSQGGKTNFLNSLKNLLLFSRRDRNINKIEHLAYLLATAKVESDYSFSRWEADFVCKDSNGRNMIGRNYVGILPNDSPCQSAINYYCSTQGGKSDYCSGKAKDKRGLPYFGRGLIQITWRENYKKYGDKIGVNLVDNPELVFIPSNSYKIATEYLIEKRGSENKSVFDYVDEGNLTKARKLVNGGDNGLSEVNNEYLKWLNILRKNADKKDKSNVRKVLGVSLILITIGVTGTILYIVLKRKNKLPPFLKKLNL